MGPRCNAGAGRSRFKGRHFVPSEISHEDIAIWPLVLCLPPTLVGGQRPRTLFPEPALAGLLEEFKSPAEAGCQFCSRLPIHQLKLVANKSSGS